MFSVAAPRPLPSREPSVRVTAVQQPLLTLAAALLFAGCASSNDTPEPSSPASTEVPSDQAPAPPPAPVPGEMTLRPVAEMPSPMLPVDTSPPDASEDEQPQQEPPPDCQPWPAATSTEEVGDTIEVSGTFDGGMKRFVGVGELGSGSQNEDQPTFFSLKDGAVMRNVILGFPAADGIHCEGSCTLENVWWEDVGEDAATFSSERESDVMIVRCGGARQAADKIFQHNGSGTMLIDTFFAEDFGKVYRSCGNCREQFERHVQIRNLTARDGGTVAGINENFGDTATFEDVSIEADITVCELYRANDTGDEPVSIGDGPDGVHCLYQSEDIHSL